MSRCRTVSPDAITWLRPADLLVWQASRLKINVVQAGRRVELRMQGAATVLKERQLSRALAAVPPNAWLYVPMEHLRYIDHAWMELLEEWQRSNQGKVLA